MFLGVAVSEYDDGGWPRLEAAESGVRALAGLLEADGYTAHVLASPTRDELLQVLTQHDKLRSGGFRGPLVLVWAGHGEPIRNRLALMVRNSPSGAGKDVQSLDPDALMNFSAESGSLDSLVIIDACSAGAADARLLEAHIHDLERTSWPGKSPAFACIVSCKAIERARDGAFLGELVELLTQGPEQDEKDPLDLLWGPNSERIPLAALIEKIAHRKRSDQHPRTWYTGGSGIMLRNPRYAPVAQTRLVDESVRLARGLPPRDEVVVSPAIEALVQRAQEQAAGLWLLTGGPGSGKSTALRHLSGRLGAGLLQLRAAEGPVALATAVRSAMPSDMPIALDALDEAKGSERASIVELAAGWARERFVVVTSRGDEPAAIAELVIDVEHPRWLGDALHRYIVNRLRTELDES